MAEDGKMMDLIGIWIGMTVGNAAYFLIARRKGIIGASDSDRIVSAFIWPTVTIALVAAHRAILSS